MDISKDTTVFVLRDGITIYGEPIVSPDWIIQRVGGKKKTYRSWVKGDTIGKATGQNITKGGVTFLEIECLACVWTRRNFLDDWYVANVMGYIPLTSLASDIYVFQKDGTPLSFPETIVPEVANNGVNSGTGTGTGTSYTTLLWVLVFLLAMVAGYKALNRKRKN